MTYASKLNSDKYSSPELFKHCVKYTRVRDFSNPYIPVNGQNRRFYPYTRTFGSEESRILAYFTQY